MEESSQDFGVLKRRHLVLVLIISFLVSFDNAVVIPIIANYSISLGASTILAGLIVGIYSIVTIPANVVMGRIVDKFRRKALVPAGVFLDGVSMMFYFLANSPLFLLLSRIVHGIGGGFGGPSTMSYLGDNVSKERSGKGLALYGMAIALSMLVGFAVGGVVAEAIGYRSLFLTVAILLFAAGFLSFTLPEGYQPKGEKIPITEEIRIFKETILKNVSVFPYMAILAISFNLGIVTVAYAVILGAVGYTSGQIGMLLAIMVLFSLLLQYPAGVMGDRVGKSRITTIGLVITAVSFLILLISIEPQYAVLGMIILGIGHGTVFPNSAALIRDRSSEENRGIATGTFYALNVTGVAIGAPLSGIVYDTVGWQYAILLGVVMPLICAIMYFAFGRKEAPSMREEVEFV